MSEMLIGGNIDAALEELRKPDSVAVALQRSPYQDEAGLRKYIKHRFPRAKVEITETEVLIWKKKGKVYPWVVMKNPGVEFAGVLSRLFRNAAACTAAALSHERTTIDGGKGFKSQILYGKECRDERLDRS